MYYRLNGTILQWDCVLNFLVWLILCKKEEQNQKAPKGMYTHFKMI